MLTSSVLLMLLGFNTEGKGQERQPPPVADAVAIAPSSDGSRLAVGGLNGTVTLLDFRTKQALLTLQETKNLITAVSFSPNGNHFGWVDVLGSVWVADAKTGKTRCLGELPKRSGSTLAFSLNGETLAAGGKGHEVLLWNLQKDHPPTRIVFTEPIGAIVFHPNGRDLLVAEDNIVHIVDLQSTKISVSMPGAAKRLKKLVLSPTQSCLAAASEDGTIAIYQLGAKRIGTTIPAHRKSCSDLMWGQTDNMLASVGGDGCLVLWNLEAKKAVVHHQLEAPIHAISFVPSQQCWVTASGILLIWPFSTMKPIEFAGG